MAGFCPDTSRNALCLQIPYENAAINNRLLRRSGLFQMPDDELKISREQPLNACQARLLNRA
jgi:hypothetical protein